MLSSWILCFRGWPNGLTLRLYIAVITVSIVKSQQSAFYELSLFWWKLSEWDYDSWLSRWRRFAWTKSKQVMFSVFLIRKLWQTGWGAACRCLHLLPMLTHFPLDFSSRRSANGEYVRTVFDNSLVYTGSRGTAEGFFEACRWEALRVPHQLDSQCRVIVQATWSQTCSSNTHHTSGHPQVSKYVNLIL